MRTGVRRTGVITLALAAFTACAHDLPTVRNDLTVAPPTPALLASASVVASSPPHLEVAARVWNPSRARLQILTGAGCPLAIDFQADPDGTGTSSTFPTTCDTAASYIELARGDSVVLTRSVPADSLPASGRYNVEVGISFRSAGASVYGGAFTSAASLVFPLAP